jgi:hypothetical protein
MSLDPALLELAAGWRPQRPGHKRPKDIREALVEPDWMGLRVVAVVGEGQAVFVHEGEALTLPSELSQAILESFTAVDAVIEGSLTTKALMSDEGVTLPDVAVERPSLFIPKRLGGGDNDPYVKVRDHERLARLEAPGILAALEAGVRHAFVATDLLWLDGTPLHDIPLLERKRLLDGILEDTYLIRVGPYVLDTTVQTQVTWGSMGFRELHYKARNSRYLAGEENPQTAVASPPRSTSATQGRR